MRRAVLIVCILFGPVMAVAALDAYPKTTIAEDATATWCGFCPNAYAGLEIVHGVYDFSEFVSVRYYSSSSGGGHATPETDARIAFYGVTGYPTVIFNGIDKVVGAGTSTANTGQPYLGIVESAYLTPSPIRIDIESFDPVTGDVRATVTMYSTTDSLVNEYLMFVLMEDNIGGNHTHVTRDMIEDRITLSGQGNMVTVDQSFVIDPAWDTAELHAVVFVQREDPTDLEILQATCDYPKPDYKIRGMVPFSRMQMGASTGTTVGDDFTVANVGLADTFSINLYVDEAPPGWTINFVDDQGGTHQSEWTFSLGLDESTEFHVNLTPDSPGFIRYHFELDSPNLGSPLVMSFAFTTDDLDCLVVDADGGGETPTGVQYEDYFRAALDSSGWSHGVWDLGMGKPTPEVMQAYSLLIWNVGFASPTLDTTDRDFLMQFLDGGGKLFLSGQDIGWDLNGNHGAAGIAFLHDYLHANYIRDDTNIMFLDGVLDDPVTDGLDLHIAGGDGANNQDYPDEIAARDSDATEILYYQGTNDCGAIRVIDSVSQARIVYTGFGFEGIDNPQDRHDLLIPALRWLQPLLEDGFESGDTSAWSYNVP